MECRHRKYDNKSYLVTGWQHMHTCLLLQIAVATRLMRVQRIYAHAVTILLLLALFPTGSAAHGGSSGSDPRAVEVTTIESIDREAGEADNGFYYLAMHGNIIYVSDYRNNVILSNHTGRLDVFAGEAGKTGFRNGHRLSALFHRPRGICVDTSGTLFIADSSNGCIRQITEGGIVETLAGQCGNPGFQDGVADEARFSDSTWDILCIPQDCSVLVSDPSNGRLRQINRTPNSCLHESPADRHRGSFYAVLFASHIAAIILGCGCTVAVAVWHGAIKERFNYAIGKRDESAAISREAHLETTPLLGDHSDDCENIDCQQPRSASLIEMDSPSESPLSKYRSISSNSEALHPK